MTRAEVVVFRLGVSKQPFFKKNMYADSAFVPFVGTARRVHVHIYIHIYTRGKIPAM